MNKTICALLLCSPWLALAEEASKPAAKVDIAGYSRCIPQRFLASLSPAELDLLRQDPQAPVLQAKQDAAIQACANQYLQEAKP